jgi:hypothetical protein
MSTRYIEYYEVTTSAGYEYYFMPYNRDAENRENLDGRSDRIWRFDTVSNRIAEILNRKNKPQINRAEFLKIQLLAAPVPYSDYYLSLEEVRRFREQREAQKSSAVD